MSGNVSVSPYNPVQQAGVRAKNPPDLVMAFRAPTTSDYGYFPGTLWVYSGNAFYGMVGQVISPSAKTGQWVIFGDTSGAVFTITGDSGGALSPSSGNFNLLGTANQITVTGSGSTETWSIPSAFVAPGSITATSGDITATNGNLVLGTSGNKLVIPAGSNTLAQGAHTAGTFTLGGAATTTVATSSVTTNSLIFLQTVTLGTVSVSSTFSYTISNGVHFVVTPSDSTDTSLVAFLIIN